MRGFDLYSAISSCSDLLDKFGGHKYAAGLTLELHNLEAFKNKFEEVVSATITEEMQIPVIEIDLEVPLKAITGKFFSILKQMAPFGPENQRPVFEARNLFVVNSLSNFKERHIRFLVGQAGTENIFQAVGFDLSDCYDRLARGDSFRMAYTIEENTYNGMTSIQLRAKDIKFDLE